MHVLHDTGRGTCGSDVPGVRVPRGSGTPSTPEPDAMPQPAPNLDATPRGPAPGARDAAPAAGRGVRTGRIRPAADPFAGEPLPTVARKARRLARDVHHGQVDRHGRPLIEHVERVAAAVPESARPVAFVHDVCERSGVWAGEVALLLGLDEDERRALVLLTKRERETLVRHVRRVLRADPDPARELALVVLHADVEDHAAHAADGPGAYAVALAALSEATAVGATR